MLTQFEIRQLADKIAKKFNPRKIILYGSYAHGHQTEDSDVDLLVINDDDVDSDVLNITIREFLFPNPYCIDVSCFAQRTIQTRLNENRPFYKQVINSGDVLYERR